MASHGSKNMINVKCFKGVCPIGNCGAQGRGARKMGKSYEDMEEIRRKVFNHVKFSSYHQGVYSSDEDIISFLDSNVADWCIEENEEWDQDEFDQVMQTQDAEKGGQKEAEPEAEKGAGGSADWRGGKCKGKSSLEQSLQAQIKKQTANMLHFTKAASTCISALRVAAQISRDAASSFDRERTNLEEGCEEMISAFGLAPRSWSSSAGSRHHVQSIEGETYQLASAVRGKGGRPRHAPY